MKIAILCQNFPPAIFEGGISHYSALLAEHLSQLGHEVYALTSTEFTRPTGDTTNLGDVQIIRIKGPWNYTSVKRIKEIAFRKNLEALVLEYAPSSYRNSFRIKWALTRFPCQKITTFHSLWGRYDRLMGLMLLHLNTKIIATNSEILTIIERRLPWLLKKLYWIPIGSNILPDSEVKPLNNIVDPVVCYFGMVYPGKGLDLILDVLKALQKKRYRFEFKFIGGSNIDYPSYEANFREKIKNRHLNGTVEYMGPLPSEEVSYWLNKSRFVFLPYDNGLSDRRGTFMAAIAHGKPALTSPPIVPMGFLKNGLNVIWADTPSIAAYISLFEKLLFDDTLVSRLEVGVKELSRHFGWNRIAIDHELVLQMRNC